MPLQTPNLDDRNAQKLVQEAVEIIRRSCPEWTDFSKGDPGIVMLEAFAYLTDAMIYRINRLPEKAYIEFLRLAGIKLNPPAAASTVLRFSRRQPGSDPVEIARGTQVAVLQAESGKDPVVFITDHTVTLRAGDEFVDVNAHHCEWVKAELLGMGSGLPGQSYRIKKPPIVAPLEESADLVVGVELTPDEENDQIPTIGEGRKAFRIWREVDHFSGLGEDRFVYVVDRVDGRITFAPAARLKSNGNLEDQPAALAEVPPGGREIRAWYRRGGGPDGNVKAGQLTEIKSGSPALQVTNPDSATGGRAAEALNNALVRGPQEIHAFERVVTARDFEFMALKQKGEVTRAKALTRLELWAHAQPGEVEVLMVPFLPENERQPGSVTAEALRSRQTHTAREKISRVLDERRPLGTRCLVNWARYKTVNVSVRIIVRREEDPAAIRQQVSNRLYEAISPLPSEYNPDGWTFGQALRASHIYDIALREPGVMWADQVKMNVPEVPEKPVAALTADAFQAGTWYAGSNDTIMRTLNDGGGWERMRAFPGELITQIIAHPERPGLVAAIGQTPDLKSWRIHVSPDAGECWDEEWTEPAEQFGWRVYNLVWSLKDAQPTLLLATERGLFELPVGTQGNPVPVLVERNNTALGFWTVATARDANGLVNVALAALDKGGVYLSHLGGASDTFRHIGKRDEDIRVLAIQREGSRSFLWAGAAAAGTADPNNPDPGVGCFRWELRGADNPPEGWRPFTKDWKGGTCKDLAFVGGKVLAATFYAGVTTLDAAQANAGWVVPKVDCGLPPRSLGRFEVIETIATNAYENPSAGTAVPPLVMAGCVDGIFRSGDVGQNYTFASSHAYTDRVTLPPTWLFCSGEHKVEVLSEDET